MVDHRVPEPTVHVNGALRGVNNRVQGGFVKIPASSGILPDICNEPSGILIPKVPGIVPSGRNFSNKSHLLGKVPPETNNFRP